MAKKGKKDDGLSAEQKVAVGVGLTAAAVAAAGAYFLAGSPNAKDNRRKVKSWMFKAKAEVLEALEKAEDITEEEFNQLVGNVSTTYSKLQDASRADIADFKREMMEHWPKIVKEGKQVVKTVSKVTTKKPTKKATKKSTKKSTKQTPKKTTKKSTQKLSPARAAAGGKKVNGQAKKTAKKAAKKAVKK